MGKQLWVENIPEEIPLQGFKLLWAIFDNALA